MPGQTLKAKDPNNRPVFDNSEQANLVVWNLVFPMKRGTRDRAYLKVNTGPWERVSGANLINLEFVNTKISVDIPEVKVGQIGAPTFGMHTCRLALARSLRCACPARGSDQGMQI